MIILITTFKNVVAKFVGEYSVARCSYVIIHLVSENYSFAIVCGLPLQDLHDKIFVKVCITLHLLNTFFNLLAFTPLSNEIVVMEIFFE